MNKKFVIKCLGSIDDPETADRYVCRLRSSGALENHASLKEARKFDDELAAELLITEICAIHNTSKNTKYHLRFEIEPKNL